MAITIEMPRLSDSMHEGTVLRWFKKTGDFVKVGDHLADIETDKAHVELQACEDGTLTEILVPEGGSAAAGAPIALLQPEFGAAVCGCPPRPSAICSPLAARLAAEAGLNPATLRGTGPRGKIMAADVRAALRPAGGPARRVQTPLAPRDTRHATRVDNFYLYSLEANMAYLAAISTPIAVQCEKLIGGRYSLFDYVVRAAVKACASEPEWLAGDAAAELLMVLDKGEKYVFIENASGKTIYNIAMERLAAPGFEEIELMAPLDILRRLNMDVVLAGVQSDKVVSTHEVTVSTDTMLDKLHADKLDALILPGGAGSWVLRDTPEVIHLVKKMHEAGKLVAAICAAPIVLAKAGLVKDRNVTAYPAQDVYRELNEAGAHIVKDENVVLDGNMLTANGPGAAMLFGYSIGEYLGEDLQVAQLKEQMCYTGL